jgi:hypothetical protein
VEIVVISGESQGEKVSLSDECFGTYLLWPLTTRRIATQGPVRPLGGCWYLDFKLKRKGTKVWQPLPEGWTAFIYRE